MSQGDRAAEPAEVRAAFIPWRKTVSNLDVERLLSHPLATFVMLDESHGPVVYACLSREGGGELRARVVDRSAKERPDV